MAKIGTLLDSVQFDRREVRVVVYCGGNRLTMIPPTLGNTVSPPDVDGKIGVLASHWFQLAAMGGEHPCEFLLGQIDQSGCLVVWSNSRLEGFFGGFEYFFLSVQFVLESTILRFEYKY